VGVYFVSQNPLDIPEAVLGQLGNRIQHALRAFTAKDQKAVRAAAQTLRPNPAFSAEQAITELQVGEALVSFLDAKGAPEPVERAFVVPPGSRMGPLTPEERQAVLRASPLYGHYEKTVDRDSAYERLKERAEQAGATAGSPTQAPSGGLLDTLGSVFKGSTGPRGGRREGLAEAMAKSVARTVGSQIGREIVRGILGGFTGGRRK
jgi:DNA helicase HerA-like ATPase